jgi:hypothetical protein
MRLSITAASIVFTVAIGAAGQEQATPKPPQKGDTVIVRGCLRGSALEATETERPDDTAAIPTDVTYRLTGKKDLLKQMRKEHDRKLVEVTGILKSTLAVGDARGKQIGKSRIYIGVGAPQPGSPAAEANRSIPVLEVQSYEGRPVACGG